MMQPEQMSEATPGKHAFRNPFSHHSPHPWRDLTISVCGSFLLGYLDYLSGWAFGFFVFYFAPVAYTAWSVGTRRAYLVSVLCAAIWGVAESFTGHAYPSDIYIVWNALIRLFSFLVIAFSISKMRTLLWQQEGISSELRLALTEVKTLSGLLPICASCKKIRNDKGYWEQIEVYLHSRTDAEFTHGICAECADKALEEAGISRQFRLDRDT